MGRVSSDVWGLGSLPARLRWKGGWGPDRSGSYLLLQLGLIDLGGKPVPVVLAVRPADGSFQSGQPLASELAGQLVALARTLKRAESLSGE